MTGRGWIGIVGVLILAGAAGGCVGKIQPAMGSGSVVALVTSEGNLAAGERLAQFLERESYIVPRPEKPFDVTLAGIGNLDDHRYDKNIILLCDVSEGGEILQTVRRIVGDSAGRRLDRGEGISVFLEDTWARYQTVVVIGAPSAEALNKEIEATGADIAARLEAEAIRVIGRMFSEQGEIPGMRSTTFQRYGWSLRLPEPYVLKREEPEVPLIFFQQENPPRIVAVSWKTGLEEVSEEACVRWRQRIAWEQYDEDEIVDGKVRSRSDTLGTKPAVRVEGLWKNAKYTIGGSFFTYMVAVPELDRTFLLDLYLYAPGVDQIAYLRELDAIARTFDCAPR